MSIHQLTGFINISLQAVNNSFFQEECFEHVFRNILFFHFIVFSACENYRGKRCYT